MNNNVKLVKKNKLEFRNGYLVTKKGEIVQLPNVVFHQLNKLEETFQQWQYLRDQPKAQPMPSLDGYERRSRFASGKDWHLPNPTTPTMDARVAESIAFCNECDMVNDVADLNKLIDEYGELITWAYADEFVPGMGTSQIDLYELGDPLLLDPYDIITILEMMVKNPAVTIVAERSSCIDPDGDVHLKLKKVTG